MMIPIMINSNGIRILEAFPMPLSTSLFDMNHKIAHVIITPIVVGINRKLALLKLELPPTLLTKYNAASVPQLNVILLNRYTKSQLKITI